MGDACGGSGVGAAERGGVIEVIKKAPDLFRDLGLINRDVLDGGAA
jgi:hypothetical protein